MKSCGGVVAALAEFNWSIMAPGRRADAVLNDDDEDIGCSGRSGRYDNGKGRRYDACCVSKVRDVVSRNASMQLG